MGLIHPSDKREEYKQIVHDFPCVDEQKIIIKSAMHQPDEAPDEVLTPGSRSPTKRFDNR